MDNESFSPVKKATSMQDLPTKRVGVLSEEEKKKVQKTGSGIIVDENVSTLMKTETTIDKQRTSMEKKSSSLSISKESELPTITEPSGIKSDVSMVSKSQEEKQQATEKQNVLTITVKEEHSDSKEKSDQKEKSPDTPTDVSDEWALLIQESIKEARAELISDQPENVKSQFVEAEEIAKMSLKEFESKAENEVINDTKN